MAEWISFCNFTCSGLAWLAQAASLAARFAAFLAVFECVGAAVDVGVVAATGIADGFRDDAIATGTDMGMGWKCGLWVSGRRQGVWVGWKATDQIAGYLGFGRTLQSLQVRVVQGVDVDSLREEMGDLGQGGVKTADS